MDLIMMDLNRRQDTLLLHNASARVIQTNQSLVLQKVVKQSAGYYACSAINGEGETVSNQQFLRVKRKYIFLAI